MLQLNGDSTSCGIKGCMKGHSHGNDVYCTCTNNENESEMKQEACCCCDDETLLQVTVIGAEVPISYSVIGIKSHEMPIIGTYVDPRITVGFYYRVRRLDDHSRWLFNGRAMRLMSVGAGYAKRLTFESDWLNEPSNFFWSDSAHGKGFACEICAVLPGQKFYMKTDGKIICEAVVISKDKPQKEENSKILSNGAIEKRVHIHVKCKTNVCDKLVNLTGTAILTRLANTKRAKIHKIDNIIIMDHDFFNTRRQNIVMFPI